MQNLAKPQARLTTIVSSDPNHIAFPLPFPPTSSAGEDCSFELSSAAQSEPALLQAVASALLNADVSHVTLKEAAAPFIPRPGTLEEAVQQINHKVFAHVAGPASLPPAQQDAEQAEQQHDQPQQLPPAAHAAPETALQGPPAAKRRRRTLTTDEQFVSRAVDPQQVLANVAAEVDGFQATMATLHKNAIGNGAHATATGKHADNQHKLYQPFIPLEQLKSLQVTLAAGKQAGILQQLEHEQLRQLLLLLVEHVKLGIDQPLGEHDKATDASVKAVAGALEAACCCMQLLAAPGLPNTLYLEELLAATVQMAKYQLQYNVLSLCDAHFKRLYRPSLAQDDDVQPAPTKKRARVEASGSKVSRALADVCAKLELLLSLLAQVIGQVKLEVELVLPLVRVALMCLSVDSLQLLQAEAIALAVAVFRAYPEQRLALMDEVMTTVLSKIQCSSARGPPRLYQVTDACIKPLHVQMATALVVSLVQVSVQLPAVEAEPDVIQRAYLGAFRWSDKFWEGVFARLPGAKAAKSDGATDFKAVTDALLTDLLAVQMLPEWPAATLVLRRFVKVLYSDKGLHHPDAAVKLAAVDFTGQLASRLCAEAAQAEQEADQVQAVLEEALRADVAGAGQLPTGQSALLTLDHLLLNYLAAVASTDNSSTGAASAIQYTCCRMLSDAIHHPQRSKDLQLLLVQHRQLQDSHSPSSGAAGGPELQLSRAQCVGLVRRRVVEGPLGAMRGTLIQCLVEAGSRNGPDPNPATVRTKVFKCLGCVVEADSRVLGLPHVAAAVRAALEDDSVAVREATLELLAKLIHTNPALAGDYFDVLAQATHDPGLSVRKRAIKSLWDCCTCPGFSRGAGAVVAVLQRAADPEDSMRGLVTKICGEMWFTETSSFAGLTEDDGTAVSSSSSTVRSPEVRAKELAEVSFRMFEARGKGVNVPWLADNPLIVIFQEVLGLGSPAVNASGGRVGAPSAKELKDTADLREGAADVAGALLLMFLRLQQDPREEGEDHALVETSSSSNSHCRLSYLLALHALCIADAGLAAPAKDPPRFVRALAPYVDSAAQAAAAAADRVLGKQLSRTASGGMGTSAESSRYATAECLCLLSVLEAALGHLEALEKDMLQQLSADMIQVLNKQRISQLISAGCRLLCVIAPMHPAVAPQLSQLATMCHSRVLSCLSPTTVSLPSTQSQKQAAPRLLYVLGQLCQYGAHLLDQCALSDAGMRSCMECLELCVSLWHPSSTAADQQVKEAALKAVGMIVIGKPQLMLQQLQLNLVTTAAGQQGGSAIAASTADSAGSNHGSPSGPQQQQQQQQQHETVQQALDPAPGTADDSVDSQHWSAARVYTAALSSTEPPQVKTRVLASLVELLRSEEAALVSRQKDIEAAAANSRLASTLPTASKRPLSRVNGETDVTAASSSSIIQNVWVDVLSLATGVPGEHSAASAQVPPGGGAGADAMEAAAIMRRKALELIEVVLRGGLVAPWDAIPPLVAQLTDTAPDTRQAAHRVLKAAADKYADFVAGQLAPGVIEAYQFQSRLWAAKHPGQPLPKGPSAEVLEGLAAMYADIIHPDKNGATRQRFLSNLLKPFDAACNLANPSAAAREDIHKLAFCVYVAAALPFKRADEPLVLIHTINSHVSRQAHGVAATLRRQLVRLGLKQQMQLEEEPEDMDEEAPDSTTMAAAQTSQQQQDHQQLEQQRSNSPAELQQQQQQQQQQQRTSAKLPRVLSQEALAPVKASLALSMLLVLKQYLMAAYCLPDERVAAFELKGDIRRSEMKALVSKDKKLGDFGLGPINLRSLGDATGQLLAELYKTFRGLLDNDAANYREASVLAAVQELGGEDDAGLDPGTHKASATPAAAAAGLVVFSMDTKKARSKSTSKRGGRSTGSKAAGVQASTAKGKGGKRAASTGKGKAKKRRNQQDSDDNVDDDDEEWEGDGKRKLW